MPETVETRAAGTSPAADETSRYASLLATDEHVLLVRQRHWLTFLEAGRWFVAALGAALAALLFEQSTGGVGDFLEPVLDGAFWLFLAIGVLGVGWYYLVWRVERYLVTTRRVIEAGGVINKYTRDTSLQAITDMIVGHPWIGRMVGYGEIDLLTASEVGTTKIRFLPDADGFKRTLLDAKYEHEVEVGGGRVTREEPAPPAAAAAAPSGRMSAEEVDASLTRLADMRDRGLITAEEFAVKKRELLDRL
jgi:hypothetical protein